MNEHNTRVKYSKKYKYRTYNAHNNHITINARTHTHITSTSPKTHTHLGDCYVVGTSAGDLHLIRREGYGNIHINYDHIILLYFILRTFQMSSTRLNSTLLICPILSYPAYLNPPTRNEIHPVIFLSALSTEIPFFLFSNSCTCPPMKQSLLLPSHYYWMISFIGTLNAILNYLLHWHT